MTYPAILLFTCLLLIAAWPITVAVGWAIRWVRDRWTDRLLRRGMAAANKRGLLR